LPAREGRPAVMGVMSLAVLHGAVADPVGIGQGCQSGSVGDLRPEPLGAPLVEERFLGRQP